VRVAVASCLVALVVLTGADAGAAPVQGATPAAAPFAEAWARVPATLAGRAARNIVVFGAGQDFCGAAATDSCFNTALNCCNNLLASWDGAEEAVHGAFIQDDKGVWIKDLVTRAHANASGVSYTIRPDAFWYWGGKRIPVTYRDFVYTLRQLDDPKNDIASRAGYANLDPSRFAHRGTRQVTFFWKTTACTADYPCSPYANWQRLFSSLYPSFALTGLDFDTIWLRCICGSDGKPVSDGPFYLANYTPGQGTTLKRNPYYFRKARLSEIDLEFNFDPNTEAEAMRTGAVDAISPRSFGDFLRPLKSAPGVTFQVVPGYTFEHLAFREGDAKAAASVTRGSSNALLRARWMRQAIALGIDRGSIIGAVYGPLAADMRPLDNAVFFSTEAPYRPDFGRWSFNPGKALAILRAHCTGGPRTPSPGNDKIWHCAGLPAIFRWVWSAGSADRTAIEQLVKGELKSIGIALTERPLPPSVVFSSLGIPSGDFDIASFSWITSGDPGDFSEIYRCQGNNNYTGYCSHAVDSLLQAASRELDPAKRRSLFRRADALMAADLPVMPLFAKPTLLIHKSKLLGMRPNPGTGGPFWNVQDWHWKS